MPSCGSFWRATPGVSGRPRRSRPLEPWRIALAPRVGPVVARGHATGSMTGRSFVDTNVLVYRFDHGEPAKRAVAKRLLDKALPGSLVISTQVLQEFYVVTTRKLARPLRPDQASEAVEHLSTLPVVGADADFVRSGIGSDHREGAQVLDGLR